MKQDKLKFLMLLVLTFSVLPSSSQTFKSKGITYEVTSTKERAVKIIEGDNSYSGRVVIPSQVEYYGTALTVKEVELAAFQFNKRITSVVFPNSFTCISKGMFTGCSGLRSVTIPNSVTSIDGWAFEECTGLTSIDIPNSVTSIGESAFYKSGLTSITIPNSVTTIGKEAFGYCKNLTSATIPDSVTAIGEGTFKHCIGLTKVTIPNTITHIGFQAFCHCTSLTTVTIGRSVKIIESEAFCACPNLVKIICEATTPPSLSAAFYDYLKPTLYVPAEAIEAYKKDSDWGQFAKISAIE